MLAEMRLGETVTVGEVWPLHLVWLRFALWAAPRTRRQLTESSGRKRHRIDNDVAEAERLDLVRCYQVGLGTGRGTKRLVALVNEEKR